MRSFLNSFIFILTCHYCFAQNSNEFVFTHIKKNEIFGSYRSIFQDSQGFLWFSTTQGVFRYDGYDFKSIQKLSVDKSSLSSNICYNIVEDNNNCLWISTNSGLNCFDLNTYTFTNNWKASNPLLTSAFISAIFFNKENNELWVGTETDGFQVLNLKTYEKVSNSKLFADTTIFWNNRIESICADKKNNLWISTSNGVFYYNKILKTSKCYFNKFMIQVAVDSKNNVWLVSNVHGVWVASDNENPIFEKLTNIPYVYPMQPSRFMEDSNGNIWICVRNYGLLLKERGSNKWKRIKQNYNNQNSIRSGIPEIIKEDNVGNIWIGTYDAGIEMIDKYKKPFFTISKGFTETGLLNSNVLSVFAENDSTVWLGTRMKGMLSKFNPFNMQFVHYKNNVNDPKSLKGDNISCIIRHSSNYLWVGTQTNGLNLFNTETGKNENFYKSSYNQYFKSITALLKISNEKVLVAYNGYCLSIFNQKSKTFTLVERNEFRNIRKIIRSKDNKIVLASHNIISCNDSLTNILESRIVKLPDFYIICIFEDSKSRLWAGTRAGLKLLDKNFNVVKTYGIEDGLPAIVVSGILEDNFGNLWLSTSNGLSKFNPQNNTFRNYDMGDGLQANDFPEHACDKTPDGRMFFGGPKGFTMFYPNQIKDNPIKPKVYLTDIKIYYQSIIPELKKQNKHLKHISRINEITLTYLQTVVTIEYVALNYSSAFKNKYAYKIEGVDKDWNYVGNQQNATYSNLKPGKYYFNVKACNNDGVWNEVPATLKITILPPWWNTWWFYMLLFFFISFSILFFIRLRILFHQQIEAELTRNVNLRTLELKKTNEKLFLQHAHIEEQAEEIKTQSEELSIANEQLKQINVTKNRLFSIIGHDLRNPFHVLMGFAELLLRDYKKLPMEKKVLYISLINSTAQNSSVLLENLLLWSKTQTGIMQVVKESICLNTIANEVRDFQKPIAEKKNITIKLEISNNISIVADNNMIKTVLRNLVSNAIKFTPNDGVVCIFASQISNFIEISVSDTGVGISSENIAKLFNNEEIITTKGTSNESGTGLGLILCKEFVEKHGGVIWVESEVEKGSIFKFTLPNN